MSDVLSPESEAGREMTLEEWMDLPEDVPGEFVDGHLVEEEMPDFPHEAVVMWLIQVLANWCRPQGGLVFPSGLKFRVSPDRGRMPDLTVMLPDSIVEGEESGAPEETPLRLSPPTVAVEVLSPRPRDARRDRVEKLDEYAGFGVAWYWIVDPMAETLEVFELRPEGLYLRALGASEGRIEEVPGCPGLHLDLDDLWATVARVRRLEEDAEAP